MCIKDVQYQLNLYITQTWLVTHFALEQIISVESDLLNYTYNIYIFSVLFGLQTQCYVFVRQDDQLNDYSSSYVENELLVLQNFSR